MKKKVVVVVVVGMKCENCAKHIKEAISNIEGVTSADINISNKSVIVETNTEVSDEAIKLAVNSEKYKVVEIEII
ncbi:heavy-metal-associated domain-containing protein [Clostridium gasigenes]|uniref:heavy-metal-associated domain-containing protein n=1 Tax=Clostridium gasigenes TaxID=94869 RepID=UPI001C0BDD0B|nr:heavy metal-associated domain-containing protein [Clostridium gasigenes]MBU3109575.1 heavy-metal-associated domain-containing protein [Clostridium gasigenes]